MSAPHRAFSFDRGDDGRLPHSGHRPVSPVYPPVEEHAELDHGHPSPYVPTSPVDGGPRLGPSQLNRPRPAATPGMDNLGPAAVGGGIGGIALGIANSHERLSGIDARQSLGGMDNDGFIGPVERGYTTAGSDNPYVPPPSDFPGYASSESLMQAARDSYGSSMPLGAGAAPVGQAASTPSTPHLDPSRRSLLDRQSYPYPVAVSSSLNDGPFQRNSAYNGGTNAIAINPDEIADDGDDGIPLSHGRKTPRATAAGGAAGGGVLGAFGGLMKGNQAANPSYGPVPGGGGVGGLEAGEKSRWIQPKPSGRNRRRGWICGAILAFIVVGAIVGGAVGGIVGNRESDKEGRTGTAMDDKKTNGDLDKDSDQIKSLMNNQGLHKVFPGVDYTPWGVQYPLCLKYPPSQNNVTRDMAVLTQMTNNVRLYGTDCNQTEMVLHAIDRLKLTDMKVWLGVWIDSNDTTNDRQLKQLYKILDDNEDTSIFNGAIVGNEALFRAGSNIQSAQKKLVGYMEDVRRELKKRSIDMPVATSDLGDNWNKELVKASDLVMSNIHPFFAGVTAKKAASWTYSFWQNHDVPLTQGTNKKQVISEVGWPSGGGNDCGTNNKCTSPDAGSVAGIDEMNQFMSDWICQALENGTNYFWYVHLV